MIAHVVGERKQGWANQLVRNAKERVVGVPSFFTDGLVLYDKALLKVFGRVVSFLRTGKRGRPASRCSFPTRIFVTAR